MSEILPCDWPDDFAGENGNYRNKCPTCGIMYVGHKRRVSCRICAGPDLTRLKDPKPSDSRVARVLGSYESEVTPASIRSLTEEKVRRDREDLLSAVRRIRICQQDIDALPDRKWINQAVLQICDDVLKKVEGAAVRIIGLKISRGRDASGDIYWVSLVGDDQWTRIDEAVAKRLLAGRELLNNEAVEV